MSQNLLHWKSSQLKKVCERTTQTNPSQRPDQPFTYIDVSSVSNKSFRIIETKELLGKDAPSRARKLVQEGDIIFATVRPTLKRIAQIPLELDNQVCSTGFCVLRADRKQLDSLLPANRRCKSKG